jgi:SAM-dependent methyltransferase
MGGDPYLSYWNDIAKERDKAFWIEDVSETRLLDYLRTETNLERGLLDGLRFAEGFGGVAGAVLEIGAGAGWATAHVSRLGGVKSITAVDYSDHRLTRLAPLVFQQLDGEIGKVRFLKADIFLLDLPVEAFDLVLFTQAFYMFHPLARMAELANRVLRPGGKALVCCEDFLGEPGEPPYRDISGRYYYHDDQEYQRAFEQAGFQFHRQPLGYLFYPNPNAKSTANYLAFKP